MKRIEVVYDGKVLRPKEPVDLEPNAHYHVTIELVPTRLALTRKPDSIARIRARARDLGVLLYKEETFGHTRFG